MLLAGIHLRHRDHRNRGDRCWRNHTGHRVQHCPDRSNTTLQPAYCTRQGHIEPAQRVRGRFHALGTGHYAHALVDRVK